MPSPLRPALSPADREALVAFGASESVLSDLSGCCARLSGRPGRVARAERGSASVLTPDGPVVVALLPGDAPCVGDWVVCGETARGTALLEVLPRRTAFVRHAAAAATQAQVLAANLDLALIVVGVDRPPRLTRIERFLTLAWDSGAGPVVVLTKADVAGTDATAAAVEQVATAAPGAVVLAVSGRTGAGIDDLRAHLGPGRTAALLGSSGAGKSTLVNALTVADLVPTGDVRGVDGKGRHTTTWRELVLLPGGGALIDTPGLRGVALWTSGDGLEQAFSDVDSLAVDCRFSDCGHDGEPGCAVAAAVDAGVLDQRRVDSHRKLGREAAWVERKQDARLRAEHARRWKLVARENRVRGHR